MKDDKPMCTPACIGCDGKGCDRCEDSGFFRKTLAELSAPMRNWRFRA
jgi:hypothetical protein